MVQQQGFLHAQVDSVNIHNLNSTTSMMNGRASSSSTSSGVHTGIGFTGANLGLHPLHHASNNHHGVSATNFSNNHHQIHHHLGQNSHRSRHLSNLATAATVSLNPHLPHSQFNNSNLSQNSHHHHHHLSLSSNSSALSSMSTSSSPTASISPSSITLGLSPQSNLGATSFHHAANSSGNAPHHYQAGNNHVTDNSHLSSPQQQPQQQQQQPNGSQNTSRYKTELCRPFEENGTCKYGEKCQFAHGMSELRTLTRHPKYKTEFCRTFHTTGFCPYGPRCHFIHNSKTPTNQSSMNMGTYASLPFGHQSSHSASPSTSPISSTSSATTTNGSLSSSESTTSSSPPSSSRLLDSSYTYGTLGQLTNGITNKGISTSVVGNRNQAQASSNASANLRRNENDEVSPSSACASETQRLFWLHSHMNEGSRWPPAMCAGGLIGGNNARRTWQMQA